MCDRQVALLGDGALRDLPGGVEEYLDLRREALAAPVAPPVPCPAAPARRSARAPADPRSAADVRAARKEVGASSAGCRRSPSSRPTCTTRWPRRPPTTSPSLALDAELRALAAEKDELEAAWLEAAEIAG